MNRERVVDVIGRLTRPLFEIPDKPILGVALGWRGDGPLARARADEYCLVAYVEQLDPVSKNRAIEFCLALLSSREIPLPLEEIKVVEVGRPFRPLAFTGSEHGTSAVTNTKKWFEGLRPGIGVSNPTSDDPNEEYFLDAGTIGFFVKDPADDKYLVSCNHVIARSRMKDDNRMLGDEMIIQPAALDLSGYDLKNASILSDLRRYRVAKLTAYVPLKPHDPTQTTTNEVDAALAAVIASDRNLELTRLPYGGCILDKAAIDSNGEIVGSGLVYKVGRTTGYTEGSVTEINASLDVEYDGVKAHFVNQIAVSRTPDNSTASFADQGDSGSALLTDRHEVAGLIFAGGQHRTYANPIASVLNELSTELRLTLSLVT